MARFNDKNSLLVDQKRLARRPNFRFRKPSKKKLKNPEPTAFHFLDLNPETEATVRVARRRRVRKGAIIAASLIVFMGLVSLFKLVWKEAFLNGSTFQLRHISVVTEGALTPDEIVASSGLHDGMNMLMISLANVRHRIEELPQVKKASIERSYPGMITITVRQREPVAWLECPQQSVPAKSRGVRCMLDEKGCVMPHYEGETIAEDLPTILVAKLKHIVPGEPVESPAVMAALSLLHAHADSSMGKVTRIVKVDASKGYALQADFDTKMKVTFSRYDLPSQLRRLAEVVNHANSTGQEAETVNLLVGKFVPVTFRKAQGSLASSDNGGRSLMTARTLAKAY